MICPGCDTHCAEESTECPECGLFLAIVPEEEEPLPPKMDHQLHEREQVPQSVTQKRISKPFFYGVILFCTVLSLIAVIASRMEDPDQAMRLLGNVVVIFGATLIGFRILKYLRLFMKFKDGLK